MSKIIWLYLLLLPLFAGGQPADNQGIPDIPSPPRLVNDFADMLSTGNEAALETKLRAYNDSTSTQITIVTVETLGDYEISDYAVRLGRKWGIGQKDKNNGILILVAKNDREVDIEVGYGLESSVTDYDSRHIIEEQITPAFKQSNYYKGLDEATDRLIGLMQGTFTSDAESSSQELPTWVIILIIVIIVLFIIISPGGTGGVLLGGGGWSSGGGSGGGWSSGGGGFGGFGGGSFGGGGSSGKW